MQKDCLRRTGALNSQFASDFACGNLTILNTPTPSQDGNSILVQEPPTPAQVSTGMVASTDASVDLHPFNNARYSFDTNNDDISSDREDPIPEVGGNAFSHNHASYKCYRRLVFLLSKDGAVALVRGEYYGLNKGIE